jgi:two-component system cell cycle sensor histidine kinase/response regulator CckA
VLFMSGYPAETIVQRGLLEPGAVFLEKPFTPDALAKKVRQALDATVT